MPLIIKKIFSLSTLALVVALTLSAIAAWYSVVGLTAIFAAAVIPIIIMGGSLEVAKVVTTVWLHRYWDKCGKIMKTYLTGAVAVLALVTSMGIFGFLSKAHMDQGVPTGDVAAQIQLIDEKINIQKELISSERQNIEAARKTLSQMDAQLTARLDRGESEAGVERAVQIRAQQRRERSALNSEIGSAQKRIEASNQEIQKLNLEKAPIAAKFRKIEAEVGPIKYIAALIYGDNPDTATLERAVRWVIILLIFVFDPLALMLVIAAISSYKWEFVRKEEFIVVEGQGYVPLSPSERESGLDPFASVEPIGTPITKKAAVKKRLQEKFQNFAQQAKRFFQTSKEKFKKKNQNQQNQEESQQENQEEKLNELPTKLKFNQKLNIQLLKLSTKLNQLKQQSLLLKNKILKLKK